MTTKSRKRRKSAQSRKSARAPKKRRPKSPRRTKLPELPAAPVRGDNVSYQDTPLPLRVAQTQHDEILRRITALEGMVAELRAQLPGIGHNLRPLSIEEFEDAQKQIANLKAQPITPAAPATEAKAAESKLRAYGTKIVESLSQEAIREALKEVGRKSWATYGDRLIALADLLVEWLKGLNLF
jgi:hypothetical protein